MRKTMKPTKIDLTTPTKHDSPVALVTGSSKGIGFGCAKKLNDMGFRVALHYRSDQELAENCLKNLSHSQAFCHDLSDPSTHKLLIENVENKMKDSIAVLVNNAGATFDKLMMMAKLADLQKTLAINLVAVCELSRLASKAMIKRKWGRIIHITSILGHKGQRGQSFYSASKAAVTTYNKSIASELARFNVLCNCVAPGYITTNMTADMHEKVVQKLLQDIYLKRPGSVDEVAAAVGFLASNEASYITGSTIHVNGGMFGY